MSPTTAEEMLGALAESDLDERAKQAVLSCLDDGVTDVERDELLNEGSVYLASVAVEGFRGIGPLARLELRPTRGLTIVAGPNGCGKSSFAEAVERTLFGTVERWESAAADAREDWRNVHRSDAAHVELTLLTERSDKPITLAVAWAPGDDLPEGAATLRRPGSVAQPWDPHRWRSELDAHPPVLPYSALRQVIGGKQSELFDAFDKLLGLGSAEAVDRQLMDGVKAADVRLDREKIARKAVRSAIEASAIDELMAILPASSKRSPTPEPLRAVLHTLGAGTGAKTREAASYAELPDVDLEAVMVELGELGRANAVIHDHGADVAARAARLAELLGHAIALHERGGSEPCPVCGVGVLDDDWRTRATEDLGRHRAASAELAQAERGATNATDACLDRLSSLVALRPSEAVAGSAELVDLVRALHARVQERDAAQASLGEFEEISARVITCREQAMAVLSDIAARKEPVDAAFAEWSNAWDSARDSAEEKSALTNARSWVRSQINRMRKERLESINDRALATWDRLRQSSSVVLDPLEPEGANTRRRLELTCLVDGLPAKARSVLSQGELHAVALSLFVPRSLHPSSPFGFLLIDDPVQALDQSKIDGLAEVLADLALERQVIVFTHDDRLPEAIERLGIDADVVCLSRSAGSEVHITMGNDSVRRALSEAHSLAKDAAIPKDIASRAVAGCCRTAVEQSAARAHRRAAMKKHQTIAEIDIEIEQTPGFWDRVALGVWGETSPGTAEKVDKRFGHDMKRLLGALNTAGHEELRNWQPHDLLVATRRAISTLFGDDT